MNDHMYDGITYVISCGGQKLDRPAPARDLYTGQMFRHALTNVERLIAKDAEPFTDWQGNTVPGRDARILILSARYGLVELGTVLEPYDLRMGQPGSVTAEQLAEQAFDLGIDWGADVYAFLPAAYLARLDEALRTLDVYVQDVYEGAVGSNDRPGIGPQRRVLSIVGQPDPTPAPAEPAGTGPFVWIGADVQGFTWGVPILVSYGRLRRATGTLPVAHAPWVLDSRGFKEIAEHGRWTITPEQYAADIRRYIAEIGRLEWVAPQDWPAAADLLAKTGLSEEEHQRLTCASVVHLREMLGDLVPVTAVVTAETLDGYLRHIAIYAEYGIDLHAEQNIIGVGALVKRKPAETAAIIRALHGAGLRRLHGFGVKGPALDLVGDRLESVDSATWSLEVRHRAEGPCPHGIVKWERNCPVAAAAWAARQRSRGDDQDVQLAFDLESLFDWAADAAYPPARSGAPERQGI